MADIDLTATDASYTFGDGAIFERVTAEGSGTGNYDPFLTIDHKDTEAGYNTDETKQLDNVDGGDRTQDLLLSSIPIKVIDGVAYYEFRVDLNEDNNDPLISIERLELYTSSAGATSADFQGLAAADAFLLSDGYNKIFDLDSGGDNRLLLSDVTSSGSGTDDYRFLVPVSAFGDVDPSTTYVTMFTVMGLADDPLDSSATFEEWNTEIAATINGIKFEDLNHNGVQDNGEQGLGGVTVFIDANRDGDLDNGEVSTVTASDGTFHFYGVTTTYDDGNVWVDEVVPDGYEQTTGDHTVVSVSDGGEVSAAIGNAPLYGSISGTKTADTDNNDTGDTPVAGWTVYLYEDDNGNGQIDAGDDLITSTTTAADGSYSFADLTPGTYIVQEETQSGWHNVTATTVGVTVTAGSDSSANFVNEALGSISGTKTADTDNNDTGDTPVAGWTVYLYEDDNGNGQIDAGDDLITSTTTAADGSYSFTDLAPGTYIVQEETQSGWQAVTDITVGTTVTAGGDATVDFVNEELGSISGTKTADTDNNDTGDTPVQGWTVYLYEDDNGNGQIDSGDDLITSTTTAADGSYSFTDLAPGTYIVEEETRSGWQALTDVTVGTTVTAGGDSTVDFVNEELGSISGTKMADTDNNDTGDTPVQGWTVYLYEDDNGNGQIDSGDDLITSTTTAADGSYSFTDLAPGTYIVEEETRSGWQAITDVTVGTTVTAGGDATVDFVNEELGSISGTKMADTDNNDTGDTPVQGWTVYLYEDDNGNGVIDSGDDLITSTTTAADGSYSFDDLAPGTYIVEEETRSGWQALTDVTVGTTVTAGGDSTVDFVNEELGSISGTKMEDTDNNDTGDSPVSGWTIYLYQDDNGNGVIDSGDDLITSTTTAADGSYSFDDLAPGTYIVQEETQSGWQAVTDVTVGTTVTAGGDATVDFVNEQLASLSGYKFADLNNNGVWDQGSGENGISGWSISLYNDNGDHVLGAGDTLAGTTQTDANGYYEFTDLAPGNYIIVEGSMTGWVQTAPNGSDSDPESGDVNGGGSGFGEYGYAIDLMGGDANGDNDFGNYLIPGPGVRTPGFWGSPNGLKFWDGIVGNETKSGPNFPSGELAPDGYLILCDDGDGVVETGELKISITDAQKIINASNKNGGDAGFMLARDVIAATLNALAGNPIGDVNDPCSPAYFICQGVDWLIKYENNNQSGAGDPLTYSDITSHKVTSNTAAWNVGVSDDGIEAGKTIHSALDEYNNYGTHCGVQYATDGDSEVTSFELQYNVMTFQTNSDYLLI